MFSEFYLLNPQGDTLVYRDFNTSNRTPNTFYKNVNLYLGKKQETPIIFEVQGTFYIWTKRENIYIVLTSNITEVSSVLCIEILRTIIQIVEYFQSTRLNETSIQINSGLIYEILDEVFDFGYPQLLSIKDIKKYIMEKPIEKIDLRSKLHTLLSPLQHVNIPFMSPIIDFYIKESVNIVIDFCNSDIISSRINIHGRLSIKSDICNTHTMEIKWNFTPMANNNAIVNNNIIDTNNNSPSSQYQLYFDDNYITHTTTKEYNKITNANVKIPPNSGIFTLLGYTYSTTNIQYLPLNFRVYCTIITTEQARLTIQLNSSCTIKDLKISIPINFNTTIKCSHSNMIFDTASNKISSSHTNTTTTNNNNSNNKNTEIHYNIRASVDTSTVYWNLPHISPSSQNIYLYTYLHTIDRTIQSIYYNLSNINIKFTIPDNTVSRFSLNTVNFHTKNSPSYQVHYTTMAKALLRIQQVSLSRELLLGFVSYIRIYMVNLCRK